MNNATKIAIGAGVVIIAGALILSHHPSPSVTYPRHVHTWVSFEVIAPNVQTSAYAPYVDWVDVTSGGNAFKGSPTYAQLHAAGIKVVPYSDPSHHVTPPTTYLNTLFTSADWAHACNGEPVVWNKPGHTLTYINDIRNPDVAAKWKQDGDHLMATVGGFDAMFEDTADDPFSFASPAPPADNTSPCNPVTQADWTAADYIMENAFGYPVIFNGLGSSGGGVSPRSEMLLGPALGGMDEGCDDNYNATPYAISLGTKWLGHRDAQMLALAYGKDFVCHHLQHADASTVTAIRMFHYASFLLLFDYATDIYSTQWTGGTSNVSVMPETLLVPNNPVLPTPTNMNVLFGRDGAYHRLYKHCALNGVDKGQCDVVVNPTKPTSKNPGTITLIEPFTVRHVLKLSGAGILDGGTATIISSSPTSLGSGQGLIAFP